MKKTFQLGITIFLILLLSSSTNLAQKYELLEQFGSNQNDKEKVEITLDGTSIKYRGVVVGDYDGDGNDELAVDFNAVGLWIYDHQETKKWKQINPNDPEGMVAVLLGFTGDHELFVDFGKWVGTFWWNHMPGYVGGWTYVNTANPSWILAAEIGDGDAEEEVFLYYPLATYPGLWVYDHSTYPLCMLSALHWTL